MKRALCLLCVLYIFSLCACAYEAYKENSSVENDDVLQNSTMLYQDILTDYDNIVDFRLLRDFEARWNDGNNIEISQTLRTAIADEDNSRTIYDVPIANRWSNMILEMTQGALKPAKESFGYAFFDINNDSQAELLLTRNDHTILAIFTAVNGKPVLVDAFWSRYKCVLSENGEIYTIASGGAGTNYYDIKKLLNDGNVLLSISFGIESNGRDVFYEIVNGEKIIVDATRFDMLLDEHPFCNSMNWMQTAIVALQ